MDPDVSLESGELDSSLEEGEIVEELEEGEIVDEIPDVRKLADFETVKQRFLSKMYKHLTNKPPGNDSFESGELTEDSSASDSDFKNTTVIHRPGSVSSVISNSSNDSVISFQTLKWSGSGESAGQRATEREAEKANVAPNQMIEISSQLAKTTQIEQMEVSNEIELGSSQISTSSSVNVQELIRNMEINDHSDVPDKLIADTQEETQNDTLGFETQPPLKKVMPQHARKRYVPRASWNMINPNTIPIMVKDLASIETVDRFVHYFSGIYFDKILLYGKMFPGHQKEKHKKVLYTLDDGTGEVKVHFEHHSPKFMGKKTIFSHGRKN